MTGERRMGERVSRVMDKSRGKAGSIKKEIAT